MALQTIDIWIGLVGIFAMLALLCTSLTEFIEGWRKQRAVLLHDTLALLLGDGTGRNGGAGAAALLQTFYEHPAINPLYDGPYAAPGPRTLAAPAVRLPSYIPARSFALAVLDMAAAGGPPSQLPGPLPGTPGGSLAARARAYGAYLGPSMLASQLRLVLDAAGDDDARVLDALAAWYDTAMDRLSGRYKRRTLWIGFGCGLFLAILMNVNPLAIANDLRQGGVRADLLAQTVLPVQSDPAAVARALAPLDLPIGWTGAQLRDPGYIGGQLPGWLVAGFAAMLGAPFWFDILNRLSLVRATVKPRATTTAAPAASAPDASAAPAPAVAAPAAAAVAESVPASQPTAAAAVARSAGPPPPALSAGLEDDAETCTCGLDHAGSAPTPDEDLPVASGGIAS